MIGQSLSRPEDIALLTGSAVFAGDRAAEAAALVFVRSDVPAGRIDRIGDDGEPAGRQGCRRGGHGRRPCGGRERGGGRARPRRRGSCADAGDALCHLVGAERGDYIVGGVLTQKARAIRSPLLP